MKKIATLIAMLTTAQAFAQQEAQFSQNMFTKLTVNPAYAGSNHAICGNALYRAQWVNFPGAPKTALINVDAYLQRISSGVGLTVMNDRLGFDNSILVRGSYAYLWEQDFGTLSFGAELGMVQKTLNGNWLPPQTINDNAIPAPTLSAMSFDAGLGVYFTNKDFSVGLSSTQLPQSVLSSGTVQYKNVRHYYVDAGYNYRGIENWKITPSVFVKTDAVTAQLDVNVIAEFKEQVWGGASYRLTDAVVLMAGMRKGNWKFGYAYDITTSALRNHSSNGHEIMIGYCHPVKIGPPPCHGHENPRYPSFPSPCDTY